MAWIATEDWDNLQSFAQIGLTILGLFAMLAVYVGVPALLGWLAGIRLERIALGAGPAVVRYRRAGVDWVLGSIPIGAHAKFYGEEGLYGVRVDDWPANRPETDEDEADDSEMDEDEADEAEEPPEEPPPPASFVAAHPLIRAGISVSGPVALGLVGLCLLWLSARTEGPALNLVQRSELHEDVRQNREARPWTDFPLFGDWLAIPGDLLPEAPPPDPLPEFPARACDSVLRFAALMASPEGYAGYLSWPVLLVRSFEAGPAFCLGVFGLFGCLVAVINLLPAPFLHGGAAVISLVEWTTGRRPPARLMDVVKLVSILWFFLIVIQIMTVDVNRFS